MFAPLQVILDDRAVYHVEVLFAFDAHPVWFFTPGPVVLQDVFLLLSAFGAYVSFASFAAMDSFPFPDLL